MVTKIAYDAGHYLYTVGKRCHVSLDPNETREWTLNNRIANYVEEGLEEYKNIDFRRFDDRTGKRDISLKERVVSINAFNPDIVVSVHHDAGINLGTGGGITSFAAVQSSAKSKVYQKKLYDSLIKHTGLKGNRSSPLRLENFYIIRYTNAPAVLVEHGFMDSKTDVPIILSETFANNAAKAHITFLVEEFKLVKKVQATETNVTIEGKAIAGSNQMAKFLLSKNPNPKIKIGAEKLAKLFIEEGIVENIRGDIAFCQSMHETGWLRYGGQVLPEQNNYCGLGATNNSPIGKGAWFEDEREGVRAQIQHLKAYANKLSLNNPLVDPRFHLVTRGIAPNWVDLNGRWAVPGPTYGQGILRLYYELVKIEVEVEEEESKEMQELRNRIYTTNKELDILKEKIRVSKEHIENIWNTLDN